MKRVYLDHASASPLLPSVLRAMRSAESYYGNPGSIHREGEEAKALLRAAREEVAELLDASADEIVFGASATESLNLAMRGAVAAWKASRSEKVPEIIVTEVEHAAVLETARTLARDGAVVHFISVRFDGTADLAALKDALSEQTVLVAMMLANNETGTIMPVRETARILREHRIAFGARTREQLAYPLLLSDACQATRSLDLSVRRLGVDLMVFNAAKMGGPKGASVLFRRRPVPLIPVLSGGGQEGGLRPGTEALPLVAGLSAALKSARSTAPKWSARVGRLRDMLERQLRQRFPEMHINAAGGTRLPNFLNVTFPDVDHENLVIMLDREGIAVSTKSACDETAAEHSHVLRALRRAGDGAGYPDSGVRISLGYETTASDIRAVIRAFERVRGRMRSLL